MIKLINYYKKTYLTLRASMKLVPDIHMIKQPTCEGFRLNAESKS